jgi:putative intracellular protease/amidase
MYHHFTNIALLTLVLMAAAFTTGCNSTRTAMTVQPPITGASASQDPGKILILLTESDKVLLNDGSYHATGAFYGELMTPIGYLQEAGYQFVIATPTGGDPVVDPVSLTDRYLKSLNITAAEAQKQFDTFVNETPRYSLLAVQSKLEEFQGLIMPGGQGLMTDLIDNSEGHAILRAFGESQKPVGLICHAPVILARMPAENNPFNDYLVNSVSGIEEWYIETFVMDEDASIRDIKGQLQDQGMRTSHGFPGRSHAVRDGFLVTSQNPFSDDEFSQLVLQALADWRMGATLVRNEG